LVGGHPKPATLHALTANDSRRRRRFPLTLSNPSRALPRAPAGASSEAVAIVAGAALLEPASSAVPAWLALRARPSVPGDR
jgi:hypothetical protein